MTTPNKNLRRPNPRIFASTSQGLTATLAKARKAPLKAKSQAEKAERVVRQRQEKNLVRRGEVEDPVHERRGG